MPKGPLSERARKATMSQEEWQQELANNPHFGRDYRLEAISIKMQRQKERYKRIQMATRIGLAIGTLGISEVALYIKNRQKSNVSTKTAPPDKS